MEKLNQEVLSFDLISLSLSSSREPKEIIMTLMYRFINFCRPDQSQSYEVTLRILKTRCDSYVQVCLSAMKYHDDFTFKVALSLGIHSRLNLCAFSLRMF